LICYKYNSLARLTFYSFQQVIILKQIPAARSAYGQAFVNDCKIRARKFLKYLTIAEKFSNPSRSVTMLMVVKQVLLL